ncbi:ClpXP protease specificity-enhancing factor [Candidatus Ishikawella capsulata]|uniref:ClpXP protease specificity-enhancing factor n=1 Tax=Candidatus Ishikawaella capsulata Mpkobe TaxID=476281 RepID=C5WCG5_9ENTR|nr:ClpXP protease specificity-enhancing factor [Candidatus Ishikawaella capsulata]BAH83021.1 ClpXP protease specificity-enhancing factor [Candidatus Ishikawaella capsulata Mpkobe]
METSKLKSYRPYLLRAFYSWLIDNLLTPYILVNTKLPGVTVPNEYITDGKIILNISPVAVNNLILGNNEICFNTKLKGIIRQIKVPIAAIIAIYASENSLCTIFESNFSSEKIAQLTKIKQPGISIDDRKIVANKKLDVPKKKRPFLRIIK